MARLKGINQIKAINNKYKKLAMEVSIPVTKAILISTFLALVVMSTGFAAGAQKTVMVGGAAMSPAKNIADNAVNSKEHTTLIAALKASGLLETLKGAGPFTLFAPTNRAFNKLPKGAVDALMKPENKDKLSAIIKYHVLPGKISSVAIMNSIKSNQGTYVAQTVAGGNLTFTMNGDAISVKDEKGGVSQITIKDVNQSNGIIHVINTILLPNG